jgi:hypothetical protein
MGRFLVTFVLKLDLFMKSIQLREAVNNDPAAQHGLNLYEVYLHIIV